MKVPSGRIVRGARRSLQDQVLALLIKDIESGYFEAGERLPTERRIAEAVGASLAPVRVALQRLEQGGYIERTQGRGTFVSAKPVHYELRLMSSTTGSLHRSGVAFEVDVVDQSMAEPPTDVAARLAVDEGDHVFHLLRLVTVRDQPSILLESWIAPEFIGELVSDDVFDRGGSLYEALDKNGVVVARATGEVKIHRATELESELMGIAFATPLLALQSSQFTPDDQIIDVSRGLYDSSRFSFELDSSFTR